MANAKLGAKAVGSIVKLKVNGTAKEFIVVHQGKPGSMYDESCNGTWLLMKNCYEKKTYNSSNSNAYETSEVDTYLNNTVLGLFDADIQKLIKQVKIPHVKDGVTQSGANGMYCKVFLLSGYEVGWTTNDSLYFPVDGAKLDYFGASSGGNSKRIAYLDGSATVWWLRSPYTYDSQHVWIVNTDGSNTFANAFDYLGIRPALVLPQDMEVDSSGNVTPPPPPATHKTLVNGTVYEVTGGKCMVDGTVYSIKKGRTLINGTGYDITFPSAGTKLSTLDVGKSVFANVNGVRKEFLVVHQGLPSSLYDASCDGTWLLMKDGYNNTTSWYPVAISYKDSKINTYLNGPFLGLFDTDIQGIIKQVKIPYHETNTTGAGETGANGMACKAFLLSATELGWTTSDNSSLLIEGAKLSYFESGTGATANSKRTISSTWRTRTPFSTWAQTVLVSANGSLTATNFTSTVYLRPCIILPSDALVDDEFNLIA